MLPVTKSTSDRIDWALYTNIALPSALFLKVLARPCLIPWFCLRKAEGSLLDAPRVTTTPSSIGHPGLGVRGLLNFVCGLIETELVRHPLHFC